jgi:hypothetical protein
MTEDAKRYRGPVVFFNQPLMAVCGFASEKVLFRVRQRCVDAGWLVWNQGRKGVAATYWVAIPDQHKAIEDGPVDEFVTTACVAERPIAEQCEEESVTNREPIGNQLGTNRESIGRTFIPVPSPRSPAPSPVVGSAKRKLFVPPTAEQVSQYCAERGNGIDAEHFVNHYQARGWKLNGGQLMKDWKAAIVTWEKNNKQRAGPSAARQTAGEHNRESAAKALEVLNAARRRNENRPTVSLPGLPWNQDGSGGDSSVD